MFTTADQITAANKASLDTLTGLSTKTLSGFEKLVELNLAATRDYLSETFSQAQSLLAAKDLQQLLTLQAGLVAPGAERAAAYGRHVYGIAIETSAQFTKAYESKAVENQKVFTQAMDGLVKNAPAGTESAVAVLRSALTSSQNAIDSAQKAARKALALAESNVSAVTGQALSAAAVASKKA